MDLRKVTIRAISGLVYCAIVIGCIFWGVWGVGLLAVIFSVLGCLEFAKITNDIRTESVSVLILDILGCMCLSFGFLGYPLLLWVAVMLVRFILELYLNSEQPLKDLSHSMLTQIYIGGPMAIMTAIAFAYSPMFLLAVFFLLWINDTGAFVVGSLCGKHKLFERISPKKTWEGFLGGFIFSIIASVLFSLFCNNFFETTLIHAGLAIWIGIGALVSIFGTCGDLIESMIKRTLHVKDSGNIIPGHGGILDRIDSLLLVMPAFALYIALLVIS